MGGLGICDLTDMNKALLAKLVWWSLCCRDAAWSKLLQHKYGITSVNPPSRERQGSFLWQGMKWGYQLLVRGLACMATPGGPPQYRWTLSHAGKFTVKLAYTVLDNHAVLNLWQSSGRYPPCS